MRWIRGRRAWLPCAPADGVPASAVTGVAGWFPADRAQQRADDVRRRDRACAGPLPGGRSRGVVPGHDAGVLEEYGTMPEPGRKSRAPMNRRLSRGAGRRQPVHRVRAEARIAAQVKAAGAEERRISGKDRQ
ncbi:hypothetical protein AB0935_30895 [Streptomyces sp. NPDC007027]|uniref:hypothetical protein n=1 Tax=Streptomyces sp. NPDC007027 TaxID=3157086 RepID=UPI0034538910